MNKTRGVLSQRITNLTLSALLVATSIFTAVPFLLSSAVSAAPTITVCDSGCPESNLQDAVDAVDSGGVVTFGGDVTVSSRVNIGKPLTLNGGGFTLSSTRNNTPNDNSNNASIGISGTSNVTINSLVVDGIGSQNTHGVNVYESENVNFNSVSFLNNDRSGLVVNGSTVTVDTIVTAGNGWHGINVDLGSGVTSPAVLTVNGTSTHNETTPDIYIDNINEPVEVIDVNNQYNVNDNVLKANDRMYAIKAAAPTILTPSAEQYFSATPILNSWTAVAYTKGVSEYQVEYIYDDSHTFAGGPYRNVPGSTTSRNHTPSMSEQGGVTIRVRAIDAIGNYGNWSAPIHYTYDSVSPVAPTLTSPSNGAIVNGLSVTQSWSTSDSDVDYYVYESYNDAAATSLRWSEQFNATSKTATNVANAEYWWRVKAVDYAGNESAWSDVWKLTIDNDDPIATIETPADTDVLSGTVDIRGSVGDANLLRYYFVIKDSSDTVVFDKTVNTSEFNDESLYSWDTTAVADGEYTIFIAARDKADNKDGNQNTDGVSTDKITVTVDNTAPEVTIVTPVEAVAGDTVTFEGTIVGDYDIITFTLNGVDYTPVVVGENWTVDVDTTGFTPDDYTGTIVAKDAAGNTSVSDATTTVAFTVNPEPEVLGDNTEGTNVPGTDNPPNTTPQSTGPSTPTITGPVNDNEVLGETSDSEASRNGETDVKGTNSFGQAVTPDSDQNQGTFAGLAWYWWLLIIAAVATLIGLITRGVRNRAE